MSDTRYRWPDRLGMPNIDEHEIEVWARRLFLAAHREMLRLERDSCPEHIDLGGEA